MTLFFFAACLLTLASQTSCSAAKASEASFPAHYFDRSTPPLTVRHVPSTEGDLHPPPPPLGRHSRLHHPIFPPSSLRRRPSQSGETAPPYAVQMEPLVKYSPRDPLYEGSSEETKEEAKGTEPPQSLDGETDLEGGAATLHVAEDKAGHHYSTEESTRDSYSFPHYGPPPFPQGPRYVILREPEPIIEIIVKESNHTLPAPAVPAVVPPKPREPVHVFYVKYERKKGKSGGERVVFEPPVPAKAPTSPEPLPPVHIPEETEGRSFDTPPAVPVVPISVETTTLRALIRPESETVHHPHSRAPTLRVTFGEENHHKKDDEVVEEEQSAPQPSFVSPTWGGPSQIPPFRQLPEQHFRGHQGASRYFGPTPQHQEFAHQQQNRFPQQHHQQQGQSPDSRAFPPLNRLPPNLYSQGVRSGQHYPPYRPDVHHQHQQALLRQQQLQQFQQQQHQLKQQNLQFQRLPTNQPQRIPYHPQHSNPTQSPHYFSSSIPPFVRLPQGDRFPQPSGGDIVKSISHSEQHQFQSPPTQGQYVNLGHQIPKLQPTDQQLVRNNQPNGPSNFQHQQHQQLQQQTQQQQHPQQLQQQQHPQQLQQQQHPQQLQQQQHPQQLQHQQHQQQQNQQQHFLRRPTEGVQATTNRPHHPTHSTPIPVQQTSNHFASRPNNGAVQYNQHESVITPSPAPTPQYGTTAVPKAKDSPNPIKQINSLTQLSGQPVSPSTTPQPPSSTPETTTRKLPELPDEIPDDLRQQLLSSGILDNADIQILDYDKVGDIPIESLPPEALAGLQGAGSENKPVSVKAPKGKDPVEMKVVRYTPGSEESAVDGLIREDVEETRVLAPVTTSHETEESEDGFRRYLPLRIAGERFPVPDVPELRGRNVTSVVVLAPVGFPDSGRGSRAEERSDELNATKLDRLNILVKEPSGENFKEWLEAEKKASAEEQAVVLLVSPKEGQPEEKGDIFMYDVGSGQVSQLRGELSAAFVRVAKENATER